MPYDKINWSGAKSCTAGLAVELKLTISASKILGGRGSRDKPIYVKHSVHSRHHSLPQNYHLAVCARSRFRLPIASAQRGPCGRYQQRRGYSAQIRNARRTFFVLYDVADHRGWLVDGASDYISCARRWYEIPTEAPPPSLITSTHFPKSITH
jgi:hypothetical protein